MTSTHLKHPLKPLTERDEALETGRVRNDGESRRRRRRRIDVHRFLVGRRFRVLRQRRLRRSPVRRLLAVGHDDVVAVVRVAQVHCRRR